MVKDNIIPSELDILWNDKSTAENCENYKKIRAAYALNMCTVSISQIIQSRDQYVMEQEYDTILNNLNLENMPDEVSLLEILKQILDVITFFKIQDEDKKFIEEDYRQALKQNLTESVNIAGLIGTVGSIGIADITKPGTWIKTGISVASTIGIGYMNYRSGKTQALLDKKKKDWELQKTAIEQLNGLRRELLDTAWNITKNCGIKDKYRLTEHQIEEYLEILNDSDDFRRFERLDYIKNNFLAYPPFWYQLGHTAKVIAETEDVYKNKYLDYARTCFMFFDNLTEVNLLRDDQIAASCALEYAELFNPEIETEKTEIERLLDKAKEYSGNCNDVLQLCAIGYLRIGEVKAASRLFWRLINEGYEENFNSEMLSIVYYNLYLRILLSNDASDIQKLVVLNGEYDSSIETNEVFEDTKESIEYAYDLLTTRVSEDAYLIPLPNDGTATTINCYIEKRKKLILLKMLDIVHQVYLKYSRESVNSILPDIMISYDDYPEEIDDVDKWIEAKFTSIKKDNLYDRWDTLVTEDSFQYKLYSILNGFYQCLISYTNNSIEFKSHFEEVIYDYVDNIIDKYIAVDTCDEKQRMECISKVKALFTLSELVEAIDPIMQEYCINLVKQIDSIDEVSKIERQVYLFAKNHGFKIPVIPYIDEERANKKTVVKTNQLDPAAFGIKDLFTYEKNRRIEKERIEAIVSIVNKKKEELIFDTEHFAARVSGESNYEQFISGLQELNGKSPIFIIYKKNTKDKIVGKRTLAFTAEGIYWIETGISVPYSDVKYGQRNKLILGSKTYTNSELNMDALRFVIDNITTIVDSSKAFDARKFISEEEVEKKSQRIVKRFTTVASINGANPIPMVNVAPQIAIQATMLYSISKTYKLNLSKEDLKKLSIEVIKRSCVNAGEQQLFKVLGLLIPGVIVANGAISAAATGALTYAMGMSFIEYCKDLVNGNPTKTPSDSWIDEAAQKMTKTFVPLVVKKEAELEEQIESKSKEYLIDVSDLKMEIQRTGDVFEQSARILKKVDEEITSSNKEVQNGLQGWKSVTQYYHIDDKKED